MSLTFEMCMYECVNFMLLFYAFSFSLCTLYIPVCDLASVSLDSQASPPDYDLHKDKRQNW